MSSLFEQLSKVNVNDKTEKKGKFTYLSWAFAWAELKKVAPTAKVTVYHDETSNMPYFMSDAGVIVKVGVSVEGLEHISYLPLMDFKNKSISKDSFDMMDVNKAIQRATVKAISLHGLGLYIYAGEDLPEETDGKNKTSKKEETKKSNPSTSFREKKSRSTKTEAPAETKTETKEEVTEDKPKSSRRRSRK